MADLEDGLRILNSQPSHPHPLKALNFCASSASAIRGHFDAGTIFLVFYVWSSQYFYGISVSEPWRINTSLNICEMVLCDVIHIRSSRSMVKNHWCFGDWEYDYEPQYKVQIHVFGTSWIFKVTTQYLQGSLNPISRHPWRV